MPSRFTGCEVKDDDAIESGVGLWPSQAPGSNSVLIDCVWRYSASEKARDLLSARTVTRCTSRS